MSTTLGLAADNKLVIRCRNLFEEYDADGSGSIDIGELEQLVSRTWKKSGKPVPKGNKVAQQCQEMVEKFDLDGNGEISFDEFVSMLCMDPWDVLIPEEDREEFQAAVEARNKALADEKAKADNSASTVQGVIRGKEAREEVKVLTAEQEAAERKEKEDSSASSVQGVIRGKEAREEVKVMNAEQEAAEKAHVAEMHSSASKIQGVIHGKETRGQTDELSRQRDIEILDEQTQAAIVIQTRARGYNTRVFMQKEVAAMHEHRAAMEERTLCALLHCST